MKLREMSCAVGKLGVLAGVDGKSAIWALSALGPIGD
jgi:hypothetical protein